MGGGFRDFVFLEAVMTSLCKYLAISSSEDKHTIVVIGKDIIGYLDMK
jgi:hypothetical protein